MSLTLPDELTWVLNLLGFMWPEADEDKLRACAQAWRDFGADVARINQDARLVAVQVTVDNSGESIDAFERYWHGVGGSGGDFDRPSKPLSTWRPRSTAWQRWSRASSWR